MVTYVLDASALLRYLDGEAGAERVKAIIKEHLAGKSRAAMSAVHWGEVAGIVRKRHGATGMGVALSRLAAFGIEVVPATGESGSEQRGDQTGAADSLCRCF